VSKRYLFTRVSLLSATAASALVAAPARAAPIVVTNQAEFNAAIAVATQPGHTDTIDATTAGTIDAGTILTLPGSATSINLEFGNLAIGASGTGDETVTLGAGTTVNFGQVNAGTLNMGEGNTGTLNINGASLIFNVTTQQGNQFNIGLDGGNGIVNMTSGAVTINDSAATPGVFGSISIGYPFGATAANATFNQSGGTVSVSAGALNVGVANGTGTYNLSGTGVLQDRGATVYFGAGTGGVGNVNVSGNAILDFESISAGASGQLYVGDNLGVGTITQNSANSTVILNVANIAQFGSNASAAPGGGGTGIYNLLAGTLEIGGLGAAFGMDAGGTGVFNQSGGSLTANAPIYIGMSGNGTYNLSGGSATLNDGLTIAALAGSIGTVNQTGGVLTIAGGRLTVGIAGAGAYNLNGGLLQVGGTNGITGTGSLP
jgi:fibronectin-binding autotransporter adhesin